MAPWSLIAISTAVLLVSVKPEYSLRHSYTWTAAAFVAVTLLCRFIYSAILYPEFLTLLKHLPTPPGRSWIKGNTQSMFLDSPGQRARKWIETVPNNGLIRYYTVGNMERVLITSPKALSEVLVTRSYEFPKTELARAQLQRLTGNGLLLAEGDEHKTQRKSLMPAFSYRHIKDLYPIYWAKGIEMVKAIEKELPSHDNIVEVRDWAGRTMLDILGVAGLGHDFGSIQDPNNELSRTYRELIIEPSPFLKALLLIGIWFVGFRTIMKLPLKRNRDLQAGAEYIRTVARQIIREKKAKLERNEVGGVDILSAALTSGTFSEENLVDQMMTFLAAGHETTATALQWSVYALCKNPEIQSRLRDEVRANLPPISTDDPVPVTAAAVDSLPYLNAFINEVLRFYPPVPITVRDVTHDTTIVGCRIPKGTVLILSPEATNRDRNLWGPDAGEFKPERWLGPGRANSGGANSNYSMLTFIHGPRSCIGQGFAKSELACVLATVVGRFEMELKDPDAELKIRSTVTQAPLDGVIARFKVVEGW
ncbi:hypothetical protein VTN77DRAFT_3703 [Rasamsonia byssochlamydoides]|uniref:uncharacterized protein n=1 Tax=Rasamsonia byssochlamydoides TaxID=89139 RepID=UPI003742D371